MSASISSSGTPAPPNPPTRMVEPSLTSASAAPIEGTILSITSGSIGLRARVLHRFRPLRDFLADEGGELGRAVALAGQAVLRKSVPHVGQLDDAVDLAVQAVDDVGGRARRQEESDPGQVVEALEALLVDRRH